MPTYIALLRGINVGGRALVSMSDLRDLFEGLGFAAKTLLQSGNVVFRTGRAVGTTNLERLLEAETASRFGVPVTCFVRTPAEWAQVIARNPFPAEAKRDPGHLVVTFLKTEPQSKDAKALQAASEGPELIRPAGRELYITYPAGIGRSKLTNALIERVLGMRATGRNWNTVVKLAAAMAQ